MFFSWFSEANSDKFKTELFDHTFLKAWWWQHHTVKQLSWAETESWSESMERWLELNSAILEENFQN